ncbi:MULTISPECIES: HAD family hydrolase [unclassified Rhodococcus (in: high G+C Gram-positive bacteria)]|uniref:HAD family hydrolase n=1 Tax=unclassified Rhodococcus (in: high G+C Gram-positive bacteria) TaxID=192944 RepID=UPI0015E89DD3|nr:MULTISPECIES: HAD family hydrolase [unclassified Rhodococcus (in: high G+C Gram-positive bacteria)]
MCAPQPPGAVIFDLDGTLVQTREASWRVFEKIAAKHHIPISTPDQFYELFAHNFFASLRSVCADEVKASVVEDDFMAALKVDYAPMMIPGMIDVVRSLVPHSTLAVLSSNATEVIRRILQQNGLAYCFGHVFGGDVEPDKARGIERFQSDAARGSGRLCSAYFDESSSVREIAEPGSTVIITDTVGDVEAARKTGIRAVGVAWGMHSEEQLVAAGAEFVAIWPQEIIAHLFQGSTHTEIDDSQCACTISTARNPTSTVPPRIARRISGAAALKNIVSVSSSASLSSDPRGTISRPNSPRVVSPERVSVTTDFETPSAELLAAVQQAVL